MIINERTIITPNLSYKNTIDGVSIKWENNYEVDRFFRYVLVRNNIRTPRSHIDGVEVYRGKEKSFIDKGVKNGETYYYSLYFVIGYAKKSKQPTYLINKNCSFRITALLERNNAKLIYNNLPKMYRRYDSIISKSEEFNKPLYRMCRVFGYEFDKIETHVDRIYDVIDIDKCPDVMLPSLMKALGVEYDWNISSKENRMLTKIKTLAYSKRGTVTGLRLVLTNLLKSRIDIIVPQKTKVKYTDGKEAIEKKRTVTIVANNFQSDFIWVEENYTKFLEIINEFLPKKLNVKLILVSHFTDEYLREKLADIYTNNNIIRLTDISTLKASDYLESSTLLTKNSDVPYGKHISEVAVCRLSEVPRKVDVYIATMYDSVDGDNSNDSNNLGFYDVKQSLGKDNFEPIAVNLFDNDNIVTTNEDNFNGESVTSNEYDYIPFDVVDDFDSNNDIINEAVTDDTVTDNETEGE